MTSPYISSSRPGTTTRTRTVKSEDPVKLIEQLQNYIAKLQNAVGDGRRPRPPRRFYEKLSFDFQQSRDLPPSIRAVVEDNRMLKSFVKEWKGRCLLAEGSAQRERLRCEQYKTELDTFRRSFSQHDLVAIEQHKELRATVESLRSELRGREQLVAVLQKKQSTDAKLQSAARAEFLRQKEVLNSEIAALKDEVERLGQAYKREMLEVKKVMAQNDTYRKKAAEWRKHYKELLSKEAAREDAAKRQDDVCFTVHAGTATEGEVPDVVLMLCVVDETPQKASPTVELEAEVLQKCAREPPCKATLALCRENATECVHQLSTASPAAPIDRPQPRCGKEVATSEEKREVVTAAGDVLYTVRQEAAIRIQSAVRRLLARNELERRRIVAMQEPASKSVTSCGKSRTQSSAERRTATRISKSRPSLTRTHTQSRSRSLKPGLA